MDSTGSRVSIAPVTPRNFILTLVLVALSLPARAEVSETNFPETNTVLTGATATITNTNAAAVSTNSETRIEPKPAGAQTASRSNTNLGALQLRTGFRLQLVAREPEVVNPVAMAFDAQGRLFVAELGEQPGNGRIKLLADENGDGLFEKSVVYEDNVTSPTALVCYGEGVFVASGMEILFLADTSGDGKADIRRKVFEGFTPVGKPGQSAITHLVWGLDNRIHGACDGVGGNVSCVAIQTTQPLPVSGYDFAFDPRTLAMQVEAGGNSRGLGFDAAGRRFTCSVAEPIQFTLTEPWLAVQNPLQHWPDLTTDLAPANWRLFPLRPAPPRELADVNMVASRFATNRFLRPTSLIAYRGGALPKTFEQCLFVTDAELRLVTCQQLGPNGIVPALGRSHSDRTSEFIATCDPTFRPVQIVAAPDGTLCIADLARQNLEVFEERGRIWRILPNQTKPSKAPDLKGMPSAALIDLLGTPNGWARDTASRLLFERNDADFPRTAEKELRWSWDPAAKLHLLHLLAANNALGETTLVRALQDKNESVRENAVKLTARFIQNGELPPALLAQLSLNANDVSPRVRYQLALVLGGVSHPAVPGLLATALVQSPADPLLQSAVLTGANSDAATVLLKLVGNPRVRQTPAGWSFLRRLGSMAGTQGNINLEDLLIQLESSGLSGVDQLTLACDVGEGLRAAGRTFLGGTSTSQWRGFATRMLRVAIGSNPPDLRATAIRFLGMSGLNMEEAGDWIVALLVPGEPLEVQLAAVDALSRFPDPAVTSVFVQRWTRLSLPVQREIIAKMLEQFDRTQALVAAIQAGIMPSGALTDVQVNFLRSHRDPATAARAQLIYGPLPRPDANPDYTTILKIKGSPDAGRRIYEQRCAGCHQFKGQGRKFGPDLDAAGERTSEQLLGDILAPNREVKEEYQTKVLQRTSNQLLLGLVSEAGADFVVVQQADGQRIVLPRSQVEDTFPQAWSLMPGNTAAGLTARDLASLIAFLRASP